MNFRNRFYCLPLAPELVAVNARAAPPRPDLPDVLAAFSAYFYAMTCPHPCPVRLGRSRQRATLHALLLALDERVEDATLVGVCLHKEPAEEEEGRRREEAPPGPWTFRTLPPSLLL